jgi:hypothetical protein
MYIMKNKILLLILIVSGLLLANQGCKKEDESPSAYSITVSDPNGIVANGQSTTNVTVAVLSTDKGTVEITTSNGSLILNNGTPASRAVINANDITSNRYTLVLRASTVADDNVKLTMRTVSGFYFAKTIFTVASRPFLFSKAKFIIVVDSSRALSSPFMTMRIQADPIFSRSKVALRSVPGFALSASFATIDTFGLSDKFTLSYSSSISSEQTAAVSASLSTKPDSLNPIVPDSVRIDTLIRFYSIPDLVSQLVSPLSVSKSSVVADGQDFVTVTFTSNIKQLAGSAISFSANGGGRFFTLTSQSSNPYTATLDNNGNATVSYRPDSAGWGAHTISASYYTNKTATVAVTSVKSLLQLLNSSIPSVTISPNPIPAHTSNAATIHFAGIPELAGYPVTFTASQGQFLFSNNTNHTQTLTLNNNGATDAYFLADTGFVGVSYIHISYYGNSYYLNDTIGSR